jgi:AraC-like DNA-binding protein
MPSNSLGGLDLAGTFDAIDGHMSPYRVTQVDSASLPSATDVWRSAPGNELVWIRHGRAGFTIGGSERILGPSELILYPPQEEMRFRAVDETEPRIGLVQFLGPINEDECLVREMHGQELLQALLSHLLWLGIATPPGWESRGDYLIPYVLKMLASGDVEADGHRIDDLPAPLWRSILLISERWSEKPLRPPTLDELASSAFLSREHLTRLYRQHFDHPPVTVVRLIRLQRAAGLIQHTDLTIREIAHRCGFPDEHHFSAAFRQFAGISPRRYREQPTQGSLLPPKLRRLYWRLTG